MAFHCFSILYTLKAANAIVHIIVNNSSYTHLELKGTPPCTFREEGKGWTPWKDHPT
jgi:hypothetical protein